MQLEPFFLLVATSWQLDTRLSPLLNTLDSGAGVYNTSLVVSPQGELRKVQHLFDISVPGGITFKESVTLSAGNSLTVFDTPFCEVGLGICYDMHFAPLGQLLRDTGAKLLVYPGTFEMTTGPPRLREMDDESSEPHPPRAGRARPRHAVLKRHEWKMSSLASCHVIARWTTRLLTSQASHTRLLKDNLVLATLWSNIADAT